MTTIPRNLKKRLQEGTVVPFVGAGVSMAVTRFDGNRLFPSWHQLLLAGAGRLDEEGKPEHGARVRTKLEGDDADYLVAAQELRAELGALWAPFLKEQLDPPRSTASKASLCLAGAVWGLGNRLVVTTNYDRVLDWTCPPDLRQDLDTWDIEAQAEQADLLRRGSTETATIWHLHGRIGNAANLILTPDGYRHLYPAEMASQARYRTALATLRHLLAARSFLFIGFSFADEPFGMELKGVLETFGGHAGPHYALVHQNHSLRLRRELPRGIELLEFNDFGQPLLNLVADLGSCAQPAKVLVAPAGDNETSPPEKPSRSTSRHWQGLGFLLLVPLGIWLLSLMPPTTDQNPPLIVPPPQQPPSSIEDLIAADVWSGYADNYGGARNPLLERASLLVIEAPTFNIRQHVLLDSAGKPVGVFESPNHLPQLEERKLIVLHYTASSTTATTSWMVKRESGVSYHVLISKDGSVHQLVPFDFGASHAGRGRWQSITNLNRNSIGISFENAGPLTENNGVWSSSSDREVPKEWIFLDDSGQGWECYSQQQIEAAKGVIGSLVEQYPEIQDLVGHDEILPDRRTDPGPAFPMKVFREIFFAPERPSASTKIDIVYFEEGVTALSEEARRSLARSAHWLKENPKVVVILVGHTDERGTNEENLALGQVYAHSVLEYLRSRGVPEQQLKAISFGEERPTCTESTVECWAKNRKVEIVLG